jgi:lysophospholipase L1-like esterase
MLLFHRRGIVPAVVLFLAGFGLAAAQSGPTAPPQNPADWPGKGVAGVYDLWTQRRALFWSERDADQHAVVFLGDSITHGWTTLDAAFPEIKVANRGIGSDTSRRLLFRLKEDVLDLHPRGVVLLIGVNDLGAGTSPADIAWNIRTLVDAIRTDNPATPVVLCHVMPWKREPGKYPERIQQLNRLIDGIAVGRPHVAVCDTWQGLATPEGTARPNLFRDGLHPNAEGYKVWAADLRPAMARVGLLPSREGGN